MRLTVRYQNLIERIEHAVDDALLHEVAETVRDEMERQLDDAVYAYEATPPAMLARRYAAGGLRDRAMMGAYLEDAHTLAVENIAPMQDGSPGNLAEIVAAGDPHHRQPYPRPFAQRTLDALQAGGQARAALLDGLRRRGL